MPKPPVPPTASLKYDRSAYLPIWSRIMEQMNESEARREYSRLRAIAVKRLHRLDETGLGVHSYQYQRNKAGFPSIKDMLTNGVLNRRQFAREFANLASFVTSKTTTVSGVKEQRKKAREALEARGVALTDEQYDRFGEFMREYRNIYGRKHRGSEAAVDLFETVEKAGIPSRDILRDFELWYENQNLVQAAVQDASSADDVRDELGW